MTIIILLSLVVSGESRIQEGLHWVVFAFRISQAVEVIQGQQLEEQIFAELGWSRSLSMSEGLSMWSVCMS